MHFRMVQTEGRGLIRLKRTVCWAGKHLVRVCAATTRLIYKTRRRFLDLKRRKVSIFQFLKIPVIRKSRNSFHKSLHNRWMKMCRCKLCRVWRPQLATANNITAVWGSRDLVWPSGKFPHREGKMTVINHSESVRLDWHIYPHPSCL